MQGNRIWILSGNRFTQTSLKRFLSGDLSRVEAQVDPMSGAIRLVTSHMR